ncbi:MAG: hypothetical protein WCQ61_09145 [Proteiniphilum sp.]
MAEEETPPSILWKDKETKKLIKKKKNGRLIVCWVCPCCKPRVIASQITNANTGPKTWNLRPYQGDKIGLPGHRWRIRDVGESHHNNPDASCSGTIYNNGTIDGNGKLTGLPNEFVSGYSYNGYMELQQGCVRDDGSIEWPCPNG